MESCLLFLFQKFALVVREFWNHNHKLQLYLQWRNLQFLKLKEGQIELLFGLYIPGKSINFFVEIFTLDYNVKHPSINQIYYLAIKCNRSTVLNLNLNYTALQRYI